MSKEKEERRNVVDNGDNRRHASRVITALRDMGFTEPVDAHEVKRLLGAQVVTPLLARILQGVDRFNPLWHAYNGMIRCLVCVINKDPNVLWPHLLEELIECHRFITQARCYIATSLSVETPISLCTDELSDNSLFEEEALREIKESIYEELIRLYERKRMEAQVT